MNYHLIRSSIRRKGRFANSRLALVFFAFIVFSYFVPPRLASRGVAVLAAPFWRAGAWVVASTSNTLGFFTSRQTLLNELAAFRAKLGVLEGERKELSALREENAAFRKEMGKSGETSKVLVAAILATPPRSPYDTVILDAGSRDGVAIGDEVLSESVLIGRVSEVRSATSVVSLFSSPGARIPITVIHAGVGLSVEAEGQGGATFIARLPRNLLIAEGDEVRFRDRPLAPFAVVVAIIGNENDPFKTIYITSLAPINGLRFLSIRHL